MNLHRNKKRTHGNRKSSKRTLWNKEEDGIMTEFVQFYGTKNWITISNQMETKRFYRNSKQCRERWYNHLDKTVNKNEWNDKEEKILFKKYAELGNKWSEIANFLPGRTDNSIKNFFYSQLRKYIRKLLKNIQKDNFFEKFNVDKEKYNQNFMYQLIQKSKISFSLLNKKYLMNLIQNDSNKKPFIFKPGAISNLGMLKRKRKPNNSLKKQNAIKISTKAKEFPKIESLNLNKNENHSVLSFKSNEHEHETELSYPAYKSHMKTSSNSLSSTENKLKSLFLHKEEDSTFNSCENNLDFPQFPRISPLNSNKKLFCYNTVDSIFDCANDLSPIFNEIINDEFSEMKKENEETHNVFTEPFDLLENRETLFKHNIDMNPSAMNQSMNFFDTQFDNIYQQYSCSAQNIFKNPEDSFHIDFFRNSNMAMNEIN